jgi:hypothetical protein
MHPCNNFLDAVCVVRLWAALSPCELFVVITAHQRAAAVADGPVMAAELLLDRAAQLREIIATGVSGR